MRRSANVVLTTEHLAEVAEWFGRQDAVVFDTEAMGENRGEPTRNRLTWISLASYGRAVSIPFGHPNGDVLLKKATRKKNPATGKFDMFPPEYDEPPAQLRPAQVFEALEPLFFNPAITKIAHNAVFDLVAIAKYYDGRIAAGPHCDTIVLQWLLNENIRNKGLKQLTERYYGVKYDHENVGRKVEVHPFSKVAHYAFMDARYTWLLFRRFDTVFAEFPELRRVRRLEEALIPVLCRMKMAGAHIDTSILNQLDKDLSDQIVIAEADVYRAAGVKFNLDSTPQKATMLFGPKAQGGQALKGTALTPGGLKKKRAGAEILPTDYTTQAEHLELFEGNPLVDGILAYQELDKLHGTYVTGYLGDPADPVKRPCRIYDGKVHADFVQYGTVTGRFSCVSGDTLLRTSRGAFRFYEYLPQQGDLVLTHAGNWKPVLRKIYKGQQPMFRVVLDNEATLTATGDHRVLGPDGWIRVDDLHVGRSVLSGGLKELRNEADQHRRSTDPVLLGREADHQRGSEATRHISKQRPARPEAPLAAREVLSGEGVAILPLEDGATQPDVWTEWRSAPQLDRGSWGRARISSDEGEWEVRIHSSSGLGKGTRAGGAAAVAGRAPRRWEQAQQRHQQPGLGDSIGSRQDAREEVAVREITPVGSMGAWDIEVADDHSYAAHGFLNHNCREPNLQNVPRPGTANGKKIRGLFYEPPGWKLCVADYGQIELVVLAHFCGHGALYDGFFHGVDPHSATAAALVGEDPRIFMAKVEAADPEALALRQVAKGINFAVVYGAGPGKVASMAGIAVRESEYFLSVHERAFPEIYELKDEIVRECRARRPAHVTTLLGRKRRLPTIFSRNDRERMKAERQAVNSQIQGSAADLIKIAMVRLDKRLEPEMDLVLSVHDELVVRTPEDRAEQCAQIMRDAMLGTGIQNLVKVPLSADVKIVDRWADAK